MQIEKKYSYTQRTDDTILASTLSNTDEIVMVLSNGDVTRHNFQTDKTTLVSTLQDSMGYTDDGFDLTAPISIYTLDDIIVIVNDFKRHGYIINPKQEYRLHLWRGDYYANITKYPIALYKDANEIPHIIYADDWNHVQIMNLDTRQVLTAAKSLIEDAAEEKHIEFYKTHKEHNKLAWPSTYDYFYGKLLLSPNHQYFASVGWVWGSFDCINAYDICNFITNPRIQDIIVHGGEHESRQVCWVSNNTLAVEHSPYTEEEEEATEDTLDEIHLYLLEKNKATLLDKIQLQHKGIQYNAMYFDTILDAFVLVNSDEGVYIVSKNGEVLHQDHTIRTYIYNTTSQQFLSCNEKGVSIYDLKL